MSLGAATLATLAPPWPVAAKRAWERSRRAPPWTTLPISTRTPTVAAAARCASPHAPLEVDGGDAHEGERGRDHTAHGEVARTALRTRFYNRASWWSSVLKERKKKKKKKRKKKKKKKKKNIYDDGDSNPEGQLGRL